MPLNMLDDSPFFDDPAHDRYQAEMREVETDDGTLAGHLIAYLAPDGEINLLALRLPHGVTGSGVKEAELFVLEDAAVEWLLEPFEEEDDDEGA